MMYKELRQEWKNIEMFPHLTSPDDLELKKQEKRLMKRLLKQTEKANPAWKAQMELQRKQSKMDAQPQVL